MTSDAALDDLEVDVPRERRDQRLRAAVLLVFAVFVGAGLLGLFGVRTGTAKGASPDGLRLEVVYPKVARGGLAVPLRITVSRPGGFDGPIDVSVPTDYLLLFDENGTEPDPDSSTAADGTTVWTFAPPDGSTLDIWLDVRVEPGVQWGADAVVTATASDDTVAVGIETWITP